jgi:hypothetical protein
MRTILAILFLFILVGVSNAQQKGYAIGDVTVWTDSLGFSDSAPVNTADSVFILKPDFAYESFRILLEGNANSSVDSIAIQVGAITYNNYNKAVDTLWGSYTGVKIAAGTIVVRLVNTTAGADFTLETPPVQYLKFSLMNYRSALTTRNVYLTVQGIKRK